MKKILERKESIKPINPLTRAASEIFGVSDIKTGMAIGLFEAINNSLEEQGLERIDEGIFVEEFRKGSEVMTGLFRSGIISQNLPVIKEGAGQMIGRITEQVGSTPEKGREVMDLVESDEFWLTMEGRAKGVRTSSLVEAGKRRDKKDSKTSEGGVIDVLMSMFGPAMVTPEGIMVRGKKNDNLGEDLISRFQFGEGMSDEQKRHALQIVVVAGCLVGVGALGYISIDSLVKAGKSINENYGWLALGINVLELVGMAEAKIKGIKMTKTAEYLSIAMMAGIYALDAVATMDGFGGFTGAWLPDTARVLGAGIVAACPEWLLLKGVETTVEMRGGSVATTIGMEEENDYDQSPDEPDDTTGYRRVGH